ncbi:hypothetical protein [Idiomarina aminovorans]|uniref:hypothetical protein n=1 Tax=Idiomarina aminovorans TaxID=2914829 RepID=UPI002005A769|nr:hypothetical protein [Idiomarina sp. ATCH4]MCK7460414.1 hypothetical protein [Idiomarina sp. ATCH4]
MSMTRLCATAVLPLDITAKQLEKLLKRHHWVHWTNGLDTKGITDQRRFYNRSTVELFRPQAGGRWQLDISDALGESLMLEHNDHIKLQSITLLQLSDRALVYLNISANEIETDKVYNLQRQIVSFFPKKQHSRLPNWRIGEQSKTLHQWLADLLDIELSEDNYYSEDWFGHELPYCLHIESNTTGQRQRDLLINLSAGADPSRAGYTLSQVEYDQLASNRFTVWSDWQALQSNHRLVFVSAMDSNALRMNLSAQQYYVDLFALGLLQRMAFDGFQQEFTRANNTAFKKLTKRINNFRKTFNITQVCSYPLAQRLYDYVVKRMQLRELEQRVFNEIEYHHQEQQREQSSKFNLMLFSISVVAALILPLEALSTLLSLPEGQRTSDFWWGVGASSLGILIIMVLPVLLRRR